MRRLIPAPVRSAYRALRPRPAGQPHFRGPFESFEAAAEASRPGKVTTYDSPDVIDINLDWLKTRALWDYPVAFWLQRLKPEALLDYGGHVGTKYYALAGLLSGIEVRWIVYDVPAAVTAGRRLAREQGASVTFVDRPSEVEKADVLLFSGALQYVPENFSSVLETLRFRPEIILINKLAVWDQPDAVALENFGIADIPYKIFSKAGLARTFAENRYTVIDEWNVAELSRVLQGCKPFEKAVSVGYCLRSD